MPDPRRGRPSVANGETPARVHVTLAPSDYDRVHEIAKREDVSVPEVLRRSLIKTLSEDADD